jgi:TolB-like protein/Tfp pilus assembly protein PilF
MSKFFEELKRRNVIKSALAYLVVAWILQQVFTNLLPLVGAPDWALKGITLLLAIGLPIWIVVSWIYELTPQGIEKTTKDSGSELVTQATNKRLNAFIIVSLSIAVVVMGLKLSNVFSSGSDKQYAIAVLPFESMNNNQDNFFFVDGMAMDIHTYLSKINGLSVISDKTIKKYRGSDKTNTEIAKELGVDYLIKGNVRRYDDEIKITAQLIDVNDIQVWAEPYTKKFVDIFKMQQDVSKEIVEQLKVQLTPDEKQALDKFPTQNMEAYNLLLKGRSSVIKRGKKDIDKALELFQQAVELDPNYAEAYAEIGNCYFLMATINHPWYSSYDTLDYDEALVKINLYLEKALKIKPNTFRVYEVKALIAMKNDFRDEANEYFEKAIAINPNDASVHMEYGNFLYGNSEIENSLKQFIIAQQLEPFTLQKNEMLIEVFLNAGKIKEAEDHLNKMGFLFSKNRQKKLESIIISLKNKDWTEQIRFFEKEIKNDPQNIYYNIKLADAYLEILNDKVNYLKYNIKICEIDSNSTNLQFLIHAFSENKKFKEANKLIQSEHYKSVVTKQEKLYNLLVFYMYQENWEKAQEILNDTLIIDNNYDYFKALVFAGLGDRENVISLIDENNFPNDGIAGLYAMLKEKDSMYHYLDKLNDIYSMRSVNGDFIFDPYRKEERFKALLKKHYLPITHWNE